MKQAFRCPSPPPPTPTPDADAGPLGCSYVYEPSELQTHALGCVTALVHWTRAVRAMGEIE